MSVQIYPLRIALCGFAGSGKSSIAPKLARRLGYKCLDSDLIIMKRNKSSIPDIFRNLGEREFRRLEAETIHKALRQSSLVIALGGGSLLDKRVATEIAEKSFLIYLSCSKRELAGRLRNQQDRPLLTRTSLPLEARIAELLQKRKSGYQMATLKVSTSKRTIDQTVARIMQELRKRESA